MTNLHKRKFLVDTDAAADDIIALMIALNQVEVEIEAITVVSGAVPAEQGVQNVFCLLEMLKKKVPVFQGRSKPIFGELRDSRHILGNDGLGGHGLRTNGWECESVPAPDAIRSLTHANPNSLTIVCLGPLTNLAIALLTEPKLVEEIGRCVVMGGVSDGIGNITPAAEFNVWADPEAARVVFESGLSIELIGWDVARSMSGAISPAEVQSIRDLGTPLARFSMDILDGLRQFLLDNYGTLDIDLPDPIALAAAVDESVILSWIERHVQVVTSDGPARGSIIIDHLGSSKLPANAKIAQQADKSKLLAMIRNAIRVS